MTLVRRLISIIGRFIKYMASLLFTVNVTVPAVKFDDNAQTSISVDQGQGFTLGIPYVGGKAPIAVELVNAPAWVSANLDTPGYVTMNGTVPADQPEGPVQFTINLSDANGSAASTVATVN
jgi:hypothetical protein